MLRKSRRPALDDRAPRTHADPCPYLLLRTWLARATASITLGGTKNRCCEDLAIGHTHDEANVVSAHEEPSRSVRTASAATTRRAFSNPPDVARSADAAPGTLTYPQVRSRAVARIERSSVLVPKARDDRSKAVEPASGRSRDASTAHRGSIPHLGDLAWSPRTSSGRRVDERDRVREDETARRHTAASAMPSPHPRRRTPDPDGRDKVVAPRAAP